MDDSDPRARGPPTPGPEVPMRHSPAMDARIPKGSWRPSEARSRLISERSPSRAASECPSHRPFGPLSVVKEGRIRFDLEVIDTASPRSPGDPWRDRGRPVRHRLGAALSNDNDRRGRPGPGTRCGSRQPVTSHPKRPATNARRTHELGTAARSRDKAAMSALPGHRRRAMATSCSKSDRFGRATTALGDSPSCWPDRP